MPEIIPSAAIKLMSKNFRWQLKRVQGGYIIFKNNSVQNNLFYTLIYGPGLLFQRHECSR